MECKLLIEEPIKSSEKKRASLTIKEKVEIIRDIEDGKKKATICREINIAKSTVSSIWQNRTKILERYEKNGANMKKMRRPIRFDVDEALFNWFTVQKANNRPINGPILKEKAQELAEQLGDVKFVCSTGWIDRFKLRYNIKPGKISKENHDFIGNKPTSKIEEEIEIEVKKEILPGDELKIEVKSELLPAIESNKTNKFIPPVNNTNPVQNPDINPDISSHPLYLNYKKRISLTTKEKVQIIYDIQAGQSISTTCRKKHIARSTVSTIWKNRSKILENYERNGVNMKKIRKPIRQDVDEALIKWFTRQRTENITVTRTMLKLKAEELAKELGDDKFLCSPGWIERFKFRYNIRAGANIKQDGLVLENEIQPMEHINISCKQEPRIDDDEKPVKDSSLTHPEFGNIWTNPLLFNLVTQLTCPKIDKIE